MSIDVRPNGQSTGAGEHRRMRKTGSRGPRLAVALGVLVALTAGAVSPAVAASGDARAQGPEGLVLRYGFEGLGNGVVRDLSGNGLDGRVVNADAAGLPAPSTPTRGVAIALEGAEHQYVDVPLEPALDVNHFTLSAWVRYTGVENDATGGRWEVLEKAASYWVNIRTNGLVRVGGFFGGCEGPGVWQFLDSTEPVRPGVWTHVTGTYDGEILAVYLDGRLSSSRAVSGRTCISGEPLAIGAKNNPSKGLLEAFWDGRLDDVRIYDRALSAIEISDVAGR